MKGCRSQLLALFLLLLLVVAIPAVRAMSSGNEFSPAAFMSKDQQRELLVYAKGLFLSRLGYGAPPPIPQGLPIMQRACFVTFFADKRVIACFGGFQPRRASVMQEVEANIAGALQSDPRARRITREEAVAAGVQITFPADPVPISDYRQVDPAHEGLFVENDRHGVAIVPGEAKTAAWAYREALRRLGKTASDKLRLYKFAARFISTRSDGKTAK